MTMIDEIHEQPQTLARLLDLGEDSVGRIANEAQQRGFGYVVIAARGTSDNAARYAQYLWGAHNSLQVALAAPSLFSTYHRPPDLDGALVVGISQSGQSPDLVAVLEAAQEQGRPTIAITNDAGSPLAATADWVLDLVAGAERAVAATKTYTAQLAAIAMLSAAWDDSLSRTKELATIPELVAETLQSEAMAEAAAAAFGDSSACAVLGRGFNRSTSFEWALKLQETTYTLAHPYSTADFRHGPIAVVESGFPILAVAANGPVHDEIIDLATRLRSEREAATYGISNSTAGAEAFDHLIPIPDSPEWLSPIPAIVAGQLFANFTARVRGIDPDEPRGLSKVTRTV